MSGGPKVPGINLSNPVSALVDTSTWALRWGANVASWGYDQVKSPLAQSVGMETEAQRSAREASQAASSETAARASFYNDAISNRNLDATTRAEVESLYASGASAATISAVLTAAQEGKGLYGVRRMNANQAAIEAAQPGRSQLSPVLGASSPLGSAMKTGGGR